MSCRRRRDESERNYRHMLLGWRKWHQVNDYVDRVESELVSACLNGGGHWTPNMKKVVDKLIRAMAVLEKL